MDCRTFDEYEDFLGVLEELSFRELRALAILDSFSTAPRKEGQNDMQWTMTFGDDFCGRVVVELPLTADEVAGYMTRIARSGCFQELVGYYNTKPGMGTLTPTYMRLKDFIRDQA